MPIRIYGTNLVFNSPEEYRAHVNGIGNIEEGSMGGEVNGLTWSHWDSSLGKGIEQVWGKFNPESFQWFLEQVPLGIFKPSFFRPLLNDEQLIKKWDNHDDYYWYLCYLAESKGYKPFGDKVITPTMGFYFQFSENEKSFLIKLRLLGMPNRTEVE